VKLHPLVKKKHEEKILKEKEERYQRRKEQHEEIQQLEKEKKDKEEQEEREYCREFFKQEEEWKRLNDKLHRREHDLYDKKFAREERKRGKRHLYSIAG